MIRKWTKIKSKKKNTQYDIMVIFIYMLLKKEKNNVHLETQGINLINCKILCGSRSIFKEIFINFEISKYGQINILNVKFQLVKL